MTAGIIARFRTMAIARSLGAGRARPRLASSRRLLATVLVVLVALAHRLPADDRAGRLAAAAAGLLVLAAVAVERALASALGLAANSVETASNTPMFLTLLPFLGSGFVPDGVDAGPAPRGSPRTSRSRRSPRRCAACSSARRSGTAGCVAVAWCVGIAVLGLLWARRLYERLPVRAGA